MSEDLRWSWYNNSRKKVHNKCNALESSPNHSPHIPGRGKLSFMKPVPGAKKFGDCCFRMRQYERYPISALDRLEDCRKRGNEKSTGCIRHKCTYGVFSNIDRGKHLASSTKYERGSLDNKGLSLETREVEDGLCRNNWLKRSAI